MGYNTTVVVYNDALNAIRRDPAFGENLSIACSAIGTSRDVDHIDVPALNHANACMVVESHHADHLVPVLVGGNMGKVVTEVYMGYRDTEMKLLECLAKKHGYELRKKRK